MKIAIIGFSGSGKSTLARVMGDALGAEVLHLDTVHWLAGWRERSREEKLAIVGDFLDTHDAWVIDGNYSAIHHERRMEEADLIVYLRFNRFACLLRAFKRYRRYRGKTRASMTEGCPEKMDFAFVSWILHGGRTKKYKGRYDAIVSRYRDKSVVIKNQRALTRFTAQYTNDKES